MENMKLVRFDEYCKTCKYEKKTEADDPCRDCLEIGARLYSKKPEFWEEKTK